MCGIAGIIGAGDYRKELQDMLATQEHRGPDFTGTYFDQGFAALGHNRLSIIDLSENGNQPFFDKSGRFAMIFNGEIYNYLELKEELKDSYDFKTSSDTEVLMAAFIQWGAKFLNRCNGMFSLVIWDLDEKVMFAARDRFGVKPFYYSKQTDKFCFSSEIKAIQSLGIGRNFNEKVWSNYFAYGSYGMPDETFYQDVNQLPGGHCMTLRNGQIQVRKWYDFEQAVKNVPVINNKEAVKEHYVSLLKDSIKLRFRADVNVGFNISGGLDSSALLAFVNAYEEQENIQAFTFYTGDERYDELPWVEEMISLTKNPLERVKLIPSEIAQFATKIAAHQDEPFGGIPTLAYAKLFESAKKMGITVLLDGQGMDEQWAGYDYYRKKTGATIQGVSNSPFRPNCLKEDFKSGDSKPVYPKPFNDEVLNLQYRDLFYTKIPRALRFNDRVSMAFSTELREPFLDYRMVEFAFSQPLEYKIKGDQSKYLLREIVSKHLSDNISYAPKRPLQTPQREWLGNELSTFVENNIEKLLDSKYANWFNKDEVKNEWNNYLAGDNDSSFHIWQWISLSMLIR